MYSTIPALHLTVPCCIVSESFIMFERSPETPKQLRNGDWVSYFIKCHSARLEGLLDTDVVNTEALVDDGFPGIREYFIASNVHH